METPTSIGKYEILGIVGRGGMGVVYRAQDPRMGRQVAIKTVTEGLTNDAGMLQRFYREAEKMGMLKHPNIVTVYDLGEQDGFPYIVMEFVEGEPLDHLIKHNQPLPLIFKLRVIEQVCGALGYAHHNDVVHRDVKPANVIVRSDGTAKLLDFGIARQEKNKLDHNLTATGGVIGTIPYMAPERLKGAPLDGRSDIFATGVLLYQFLTGQLPFAGEELVLVNQLLNEEPAPLSKYLYDYPEALDAILQRSLEKDPGDRYQTADEMSADLYLIIESLKKDYSNQLMLQAQKLSADSDFVSARDALVQLLKFDSQHTHARRMLAEINLNLTRKARVEQAQQKRELAEDALADKNYDLAVKLLEEGTKLVPEDADLHQQLVSVRDKKQTNDQILGYLRQADAAKRSGDFLGAQAIVEKAIQLDTNNSRLRAAYKTLVRQAEEAAQQAKVKALLDAAKDFLKQRNYLNVLELIEQAEKLDPTNLELHALTIAANDGLSQEERRGRLNELEILFSAVTSSEDIELVAIKVREALEKAPTDPTLLRYQAQTDKRLREFEGRKLVDETVLRCRTLVNESPLKALDLVNQAIVEVPGDERLIVLEANIQARIAQLSDEETRNAILLQAREALNERKFDEAVRILQGCQGSIRTVEINELLQYAREESFHEERNRLIVNACADSQAMLRNGQYEQALSLLVPLIQRGDDPRLRSILDQVQEALEKRRAEDEAIRNQLKPFVDTGCHEQIVAILNSLSVSVAAIPEVEELREAAQKTWHREWVQMTELGQAYAGLASGRFDILPLELPKASNSPALSGMYRLFDERRTAIVDKLLEDQIQTTRVQIDAGGLPPSAETFAPNRSLVSFASGNVREAWSVFAEQFTRRSRTERLLRRIRKTP